MRLGWNHQATKTCWHQQKWCRVHYLCVCVAGSFFGDKSVCCRLITHQHRWGCFGPMLSDSWDHRTGPGEVIRVSSKGRVSPSQREVLHERIDNWPLLVACHEKIIQKLYKACMLGSQFHRWVLGYSMFLCYNMKKLYRVGPGAEFKWICKATGHFDLAPEPLKKKASPTEKFQRR